MSTTQASGRAFRISPSRASPSMPAMRTSLSTRSKPRSRSAAKASSALAATSGSWPRPFRDVAGGERMFGSASTRRPFALPGLSAAGARQLEREAGASSDRAFEGDPAPMCLDDVADDGKPEARPAEIAGAGRLREALEDPLPLLRRNPRTRVGHREGDGAVSSGGRDDDPASRGRVAEGVREQIRRAPD